MASLVIPIAAAAAPEGAKLEFIAGGFDAEVMALVQPPGDDRVFVVERKGFIHIIESDGNVPSTPFLNVDPIAQSLNGLVFHPNFQTNRKFYVYTVESSKTRVVEYQADAGDPNVADTSTRRLVLERPRQSNDHKGGQMEFGADGYLYMSLGDGGPPPGDPFENGQDITTIDGSIIRIDHVTGDGHPDNPFVGVTGDDAIWIYGFRHPWRFSFDDATGLMYIGDVGDAAREEIDVVAPDQGGDNFGWDVMEGTRCFEDPEGNEAPCGDPSYTMPDVEYTHDEGCAVIGGYVYHGTQISQMQNKYFYADYCEGYIKSFQYVNGNVTNEEDWTAALGAVPLITSFGEANDGELYLATDGDVYKIVPDGPPPAVGTIRGSVWSDDNGNGLQNAGEPKVPGVTVELWVDSDTDGTADIQIDSDVTGGQGGYQFPDLAITSTYIVRVDAPLGFKPTVQDAGSNDNNDSDANPVTGFTGPITIEDGEVDNSVDFGLVEAEVATIAGLMWRDDDGDGIQDAAELPYQGLWAWLYTDDDKNGTPDTKVDIFNVAADGAYSFSVDPANTYFVEMGQQIFLQEEVELVVPNRTTRSPRNQGNDDTVDSDAKVGTGFAGPLNLVDGEVQAHVDAGFVPLPAGYPELVADDGAVAYWRLGEATGTTAIDIAGENHATVVGTPQWGQAGLVGDTDTSLRLDGATFVDVPDSDDINTGGPYEARSVEAWFIVDDAEPTQMIYEEGSASRGLSMYVEGGKVYGGIWNESNNDATTPWPSTPFLSTAIDAGTAYHVVLTYSFANDAVELHLNGELAEAASGVGRWFGHGADIGIGSMNEGTRLHSGARNSGPQFEFVGIVDEIAVYPAALTELQISTHFGGQGVFFCAGLHATIVGTTGDDVIDGTSGPDVIFGRGGNDTIRGLGGDDVICGGVGADDIDGGDGADRLYGGAGPDTLSGGAGVDLLVGGNGADSLDGGTQSDTLRGKNGADTLDGGGGSDILAGGSWNDVINGGSGSDTLRGDKGNDTLNGDGGDDTLFGGRGIDTLDGGAGTDTCEVGPGGATATACEA